jgi:hypothetical protein
MITFSIFIFIISFSDLAYLADINAGIFQVMQTVDPNAVW